MGMDFIIKLEDDIGPEQQQSGQAQPSSAPAPLAQQQAPSQHLQTIEQTLIPAIAAAAPLLAQDLRGMASKAKPIDAAIAETSASPTSQGEKDYGFKGFISLGGPDALLDTVVQQIMARLQAGQDVPGGNRPGTMESKLIAAWNSGVAKTFDALKEIAKRYLENVPAPAQLPPTPGFAAERDLRLNPDLDEAFGIARAEPPAAQQVNEKMAGEEIGRAAGQEMARAILPALEELTIAGREEGDILPPLEDLHPRKASPTDEAARAQHMTYKQARQITYREGETTAPPSRTAVAAEGAEGAEAAGGMEVAAAAEGGALAAAGPIGAVVAGVLEASKAIAGTLNAARQGVKFFGDEMALVAHNDYIGGFVRAADFAADSLKSIPIAGEAASAALHLVATSVGAFEKVVEAFIDRGREIARFSPEIMAADIRADIRSMQADRQEADALGPEIARMTDNWSELVAELREMFLPLKEEAAEFINELLDQAKEMISLLKPFVQLGIGFFKAILWLIEHNPLFKLLKAIADSLNAIDGNTRKKEDKPSDYISWLFDVKAYEEALTDAAREASGDRQPLWPDDDKPY